MAASVSDVGAWSAAAAASGFSVMDAIIPIVTVIVVALVVVLALSRFPGRLRLRRAGSGSARDEAIKRAAAADVAAMEQDARLVSPDAPGNHQDDL